MLLWRGLRTAAKQIAIDVGRLDQRVLLRQTCTFTGARLSVGLLDGGQRIVHQLLGQRLDVGVAVYAIGNGTCTGPVHEAAGVGFDQPHDAPQLALAHAALDGK